jgi:hypothetical protein
MFDSSQVIDLALNTFPPKPYGTLPVAGQIDTNIQKTPPEVNINNKTPFFRAFPHIFPFPPVPAGRFIYILLNVKILLRSLFG